MVRCGVWVDYIKSDQARQMEMGMWGGSFFGLTSSWSFSFFVFSFSFIFIFILHFHFHFHIYFSFLIFFVLFFFFSFYFFSFFVFIIFIIVIRISELSYKALQQETVRVYVATRKRGFATMSKDVCMIHLHNL